MHHTTRTGEASSAIPALKAVVNDVFWFGMMGPPVGGFVLSLLNYTTFFALFGMAVLSPIAGAAPAALTGLGAACLRYRLSGWTFRWACGLLGVTTTYLLLTPRTLWASPALNRWWDVSLLLSAFVAAVTVAVVQDAWRRRSASSRSGRVG